MLINVISTCSYSNSYNKMKTKTSFPLRLPVLLALTYVPMLAFNACSDNDGDEPTIDEQLSEETTPIEFELLDYDPYEEYVLFDYAGNRYVGSDTITCSKCTLDLRQGKHHLLWMKGQYGESIGFNPEDKTINVENRTCINIPYYEMDLEVTPYLMPVKKIQCKNEKVIPCCDLIIDATDIDEAWETLNIKIVDNIFYMKVTGFPTVRTISWDGSSYQLEDRYDGIYLGGSELSTVCPARGFDNIQVNTEIWNVRDELIPTTQLPKFNLRQGYITTLRGPLFSGNTSDWTVTMEPDKNEY